MSGNITIEKSAGTWVVRAGGAVLGESQNALILHEDGYDDVVYFPQGDVATAFLDASDKTTTCPHKGEASYYSIQTKSKTIGNAAWVYEKPHEEVAEIAGHMAFYAGDEITVEQV